MMWSRVRLILRNLRMPTNWYEMKDPNYGDLSFMNYAKNIFYFNDYHDL